MDECKPSLYLNGGDQDRRHAQSLVLITKFSLASLLSWSYSYFFNKIARRSIRDRRASVDDRDWAPSPVDHSFPSRIIRSKFDCRHSAIKTILTSRATFEYRPSRFFSNKCSQNAQKSASSIYQEKRTQQIPYYSSRHRYKRR